jgi:hypothetical protein
VRSRQRRSRGGTGWARPLAPRVPGLVRLVALLLTLTFGWQVSVAFATPCIERTVLHDAAGEPVEAEGGDGCCAGADAEDRDREGDDGCPGDCPCPIDCSPCCSGAVMHALPSLSPPPAAIVADFVDLPEHGPPSRHAHADPIDILHVPRAS